MLARAVSKYIRMSPRKVRYVMQPLRHRTVAEALGILMNLNRRASKPMAKAIAAAFANARQADPTVAEDRVIISRLTADGGSVWKRFRPAAFGRAVTIRKRTTHITVELDRANGRASLATRSAGPSRAARVAPRGQPKPAASMTRKDKK